ncbi:MAG: solute carrier family 26 protein [Bacteroidota bacterium]
MNIRSYLPILDWLPKYRTKVLKNDLAAGLTVGVMLIPQGMAYAMIAGLPPIHGLYAATLPLFIYAIFGTSRQLAVGPAAMVSLLTATGIGALAEGGTETYLLLAFSLALLVGLIQLSLGLFRLGFLVNFLSQPVISGFTSAAALIIGFSQLKHLLGLDIPRSRYIHEIIGHAIAQFGEINWVTFAIGIGGIIILKVVKRINKAIPRQLVVVVAGILVVWGLGLMGEGVRIVGEIPRGLPVFTAPSFDANQWEALLPIALTIALVSFMESIAVAKTIQAKHKDYKVVPNQELIALGLANIGGSLVQSFPVTGGLSRSAVNDQAGAKTSLAGVFSALLIILTLLFLTPLFYYLPNAVLASIIMVAVFGLIDYKTAVRLRHTDRTDFWMLIITFIATLTLGIAAGIGVGVLLSLVMVIYRTTRPHVAILGNVPDSPFYRNVSRFPAIKERPELLIMRFDAQLYFANISFVKETIANEMSRKGEALQAIIINADSTNTVDSSAIQALEDILNDCQKQGIVLYFTGVKGPVRDAMERTQLTQKVGRQHFFMNVQEAVDYFDDKETNEQHPNRLQYTLQSNV